MSKREKVQDIIQISGKGGLRFLFLFKTLKTELLKELKADNKMLSDAIINRVCADAAKDLLIKHEQTPTTEEIEIYLKRLSRKLTNS